MQNSITPAQSAVLLFVFLTGSSIINIPAPLISVSRNGAWVSLLISASLGLLLLIPIVSLARRFPDLNFIEYGAKLVTRPVAVALGCLFLTFQLHIVSAIIMDISMFLKSSMMRDTLFPYFTVLTSLAVALTVRVGVGRFAGMFGLLMITVMLFVLFNISLAAPGFHWHFLLPVIDEGIKPVWHGIYFVYGFPYGEIVIFCMILPFVRTRPGDGTGSRMALAIALNTAALLIVTLATLLIFGPIAGDRKYSMFEVARTVHITEILERLEALMGYSMIVASFMKATIVLFSLHLTLNSLLGLPGDNRQLLFPLTFFAAVISITVGLRGEANWNFIVSGIHPLWILTCGTVPLLIVYGVSLLRRNSV